MTKQEEVQELYDKYNQFKETAEQHIFPMLYVLDAKLVPAYNDLQVNWSDDHTDIFIRCMRMVFDKLGIK